MRIATWNIGGGFIKPKGSEKYDEENLPYFINLLKEINPEIVCLQETHTSKDNNQPKKIADALGFGHIEIFSVGESHIKEGDFLSIALISKYPINSSENKILTDPDLKAPWAKFIHNK